MDWCSLARTTDALFLRIRMTGRLSPFLCVPDCNHPGFPVVGYRVNNLPVQRRLDGSRQNPATSTVRTTHVDMTAGICSLIFHVYAPAIVSVIDSIHRALRLGLISALAIFSSLTLYFPRLIDSLCSALLPYKDWSYTELMLCAGTFTPSGGLQTVMNNHLIRDKKQEAFHEGCS